MPRYRFKVHDGHSTVEPDTVELPDLSSARREGIRRAGAALVLDARKLKSDGDWRLDVTDDHGLVLFSMDFTIVASAATTEQRIGIA